MPTEERASIAGSDIRDLINSFTSTPSRCGFEVYVIAKTEPRLKKMGFYEGVEDNLKAKLKKMVLSILTDKYNSDDADYVSADRCADEQQKFYIVPTGDDYNPLPELISETIGNFSKADIDSAIGIAFKLSYNGQRIWAYQHLYSIMIPNKSRKNWLAKLISQNEHDVFEELVDPILTIAKKIDLLVIDGFIITNDLKLLQSAFGFQDYVRGRATKTIGIIAQKGLVVNIDKLNDYVCRGNGKLTYAKKIMRITDSRVLKMPIESLLANIHNSPRWNGKIKEENGKFVLETYSQVENLIDLLDERYTRSDITGAEYDTSVKQVAEPIETSQT